METLNNAAFAQTKPAFRKTSDEVLFTQLKKKVFDRVQELESRRRPLIILKAILFPSVYAGAYLLGITLGKNPAVLLGAYLTMGIFLVLIFQNQIHDAVHGSLWKKKWLNQAYVLFFDIMGANSYIWKIRHTRLHHNYPNVMGWDSDIEQSPLARVFPHGPLGRHHKYQHVYLPILYPFYLLNWLLVRDFKDYLMSSRPVWKVVRIPRMEYVKLFALKAVFFIYILVLPKFILGISWSLAIGAFLLMMFTASIFSLLILLSPHANIDNGFPLPDADNRLPHPWFEHQLRHTNDVVETNWFTRFVLGNFNFHVAHHLFPSVNHVFYPEVTEILRKAALANGLPYRAFPLRKTLVDHYKLLKRNGVEENIFEEVM
jgi:linoleoyl-CoA desaturase